tara:strand:+ start:73 stop:726 length:654 start_codon:yes stop_codon:yes gene_type:complete
MYYLYLKESKSYKYLGKFTTRKNRPNFTVYDYLGSGTIWKQHIKKHKLTSKDIKTTVLLETDNLQELKKKALWYSSKFQVEHSSKFANLVPEDGANPCKYIDYSKRDSPEWRKKLSEAKKGTKHSKEHRRKIEQTKKRNGVTAWNKGLTGLPKQSKQLVEKRAIAISKAYEKKRRKKFDSIIESIIIDYNNTNGKEVQQKYIISYNLLKQLKKDYEF